MRSLISRWSRSTLIFWILTTLLSWISCTSLGRIHWLETSWRKSISSVGSSEWFLECSKKLPVKRNFRVHITLLCRVHNLPLFSSEFLALEFKFQIHQITTAWSTSLGCKFWTTSSTNSKQSLWSVSISCSRKKINSVKVIFRPISIRSWTDSPTWSQWWSSLSSFLDRGPILSNCSTRRQSATLLWKHSRIWV